MTISRRHHVRDIPKTGQVIFSKPKRIRNLINKENLVHKFLPKQTDIDKILDVIQRKVLKGTHLPIEIKEIQVGYLYSPYFLKTYICIYHRIKFSSSKSAIRKLETFVREICLIRLFRISPEKETTPLAIPEMCADKINNPISQKFICRTPRSKLKPT